HPLLLVWRFCKRCPSLYPSRLESRSSANSLPSTRDDAVGSAYFRKTLAHQILGPDDLPHSTLALSTPIYVAGTVRPFVPRGQVAWILACTVETGLPSGGNTFSTMHSRRFIPSATTSRIRYRLRLWMSMANRRRVLMEVG